MSTVTADIAVSLDGYAAGPNQSEELPLGTGERVFDGVTGLTFDIGHVRPTEHVVHVTLRLPGR